MFAPALGVQFGHRWNHTRQQQMHFAYHRTSISASSDGLRNSLGYNNKSSPSKGSRSDDFDFVSPPPSPSPALHHALAELKARQEELHERLTQSRRIRSSTTNRSSATGQPVSAITCSYSSTIPRVPSASCWRTRRATAARRTRSTYARATSRRRRRAAARRARPSAAARPSRPPTRSSRI